MAHLRLQLFCCLLGLMAFVPLSAAQARPLSTWEPPLRLSDRATGTVAFAPDLTVDGDSRLHVIWSGVLSRTNERTRLTDTLMYRARVDGVWSTPEPIVLRERRSGGDTSSPLVSDAAMDNPRFAVRGRLVSAPDARLHIVTSTDGRQQYLQAPWNEVVRIALLLPPVDLGAGSATAITSDPDGTLHVVFTAPAQRAGPGAPRPCAACQDVRYCRSTDGGLTWSRAENLSLLDGANLAPRIGADDLGQIHLLWEYQGSGQPGEATLPIYRRSPDGGQRWEAPIPLGVPDDQLSQATLGVGRAGQLLALYASATSGTLFFQSSNDGGQTWSQPGLVPEVISPAHPPTSGQRFSLAVDGAGRFHLLAVGVAPITGATGEQLWHLTWDGRTWSALATLPGEGMAPRDPRLTVERGNRLHAVWVTSEVDNEKGAYQTIWYSSTSVDAPEVAPLPTFTPIPQILPTPTSMPTPTPASTPLPDESRNQPVIEGPPRWEGESLEILFIAFIPVLLIIAVVAWWFRRNSGSG
ncbi:MAG: sialidase family protein [Chloroflexaceae bacterium]